MIWILLILAGAVGLATWLRLHWMIVTVTGTSMRPTLLSGDRLLVRRASLRSVRTGQIVVLSSDHERIVKRVVALPGEPVPQELIRSCGPDVPPGCLVLLGDDPDASLDSRRLGPYSGKNLLGVVVRRMAAR